MAQKDSKSELGKGIADDFDSDEEEEEETEETSDDASDEDRDAAGTGDKAGEGKPEGQKGGKGEGDEEDDEGASRSEPALTKADVDEIVNKAVSGAVGKVNSSKDKEISALRKQGKETEETLRKEIEEAGLKGLSDADKTAMRLVHTNDRAQRSIATQREEAGDMIRLANAARLGVEQAKFGKHGATVAELEDCESPEAQESLCHTKERDYWRGVATGDIKLDEDSSSDASKNGKGKTKKGAPAGSRKSTDVGGGGAAPPKGKEVTTLDSFAQSLMNEGVVPAGGITRVDRKAK